MMMTMFDLKKTHISILGVTLVVLTLAGCTTAGDDPYGDGRHCSAYRDYSHCMSMHQRRLQREQLMNQEKALINAEQARENLRMLREIRRRREGY
jgi:hypothetical protein